MALRLRTLLAAAGVEAFVKTTGSLGLHVHARLELDRAAGLARSLGGRLAREDPDAVTEIRDPVSRKGRVLVDWRQSSRRVLTIVPYSLRATDDPRVATPVTWTEIETAVAAGRPELLRFSPDAVLERCARVGDPMLGAAPGAA